MAIIRLAGDENLPVLRDVERAAGTAFADIGMAFVADDEAPSIDTQRASRDFGAAAVFYNAATAQATTGAAGPLLDAATP